VTRLNDVSNMTSCHRMCNDVYYIGIAGVIGKITMGYCIDQRDRSTSIKSTLSPFKIAKHIELSSIVSSQLKYSQQHIHPDSSNRFVCHLPSHPPSLLSVVNPHIHRSSSTPIDSLTSLPLVAHLFAVYMTSRRAIN